MIERVKFLGRKQNREKEEEGSWGDWQPFAFQDIKDGGKEVVRFHLGKRGSGTIASLAALSTYEIKAAAKNESGWGPWCTSISITTLKEVPQGVVGGAAATAAAAPTTARARSSSISSARERVAAALTERAARNASAMLSSWLNTSRSQSHDGTKPILIAVLRRGWTECFVSREETCLRQCSLSLAH